MEFVHRDDLIGNTLMGRIDQTKLFHKIQYKMSLLLQSGEKMNVAHQYFY